MCTGPKDRGPGFVEGFPEAGIVEVGIDEQVDGAVEKVVEVGVEAVVDADVRRIGIRKERDEEIGVVEVGAALSG